MSAVLGLTQSQWHSPLQIKILTLNKFKMKYAIKILKDQQKKENENKKKSIAKDSYKGVLDSEKNVKDLDKAITALEKIK